MEKDVMADAAEVSQALSTTWSMISLSAGISAGILTMLSPDAPVTVTKIADDRRLDPEKLESWFSFAERFGVVARRGDGYVLSPRGLLVSPHSPSKDLLAFVQLTEYFMNAAVNAREAFQKGKSLDSLSQGKITRDYQPRVSDNLSTVVLAAFKENEVSAGQSLLDVGSGAGSFLRSLAKRMPGVKLTGSDSNLFAVETARKENRSLGLTDQIKMLVADMENDMGDFADGSFDWVTAINIFHYVDKDKRQGLVDHFVRIARRGVFMTEGLAEGIPLMSPADFLLRLLWDDYSGFFTNTEVEAFNSEIRKRHPHCAFTRSVVVGGTAYLVILRKP